MRRFVTKTVIAIALLALVYAVPVVNEERNDPAHCDTAWHATITPSTATTTLAAGPFVRRTDSVEPGSVDETNANADANNNGAINPITPPSSPNATVVTTTTTATTTVAITHETIQTTIVAVNQTIQQVPSTTTKTEEKEPTPTLTRSASSSTATEEKKNDDDSGSFSTVGIALTAVGAIVASLCCMFLLYQYARRGNASTSGSGRQRSWIPIAL